MSNLPNPKEFASFKAELSKTIKFDEVEQNYDLKNIFDSLQNNSIPSGYISKLIDLEILEHNPKTKEILKRFICYSKLDDSIVIVLKDKEEPKKRSFIKEKRSRKDEFVLEVDLHIEKLVPSKRGMSNYDILTLQIETAKRQLDFAIKNRMPKVVFIHGVGEGVLKADLDFLLGRYDNISFQDANYQKYGLGATEVYIKQNVK